MNKLDVANMVVTNIQFFDCTRQIQVGENEYETLREYSANIIFDDSLVVQLSGNDNESHRPTVPSSAECYYDDAATQDYYCHLLADGDLCIDVIIDLLSANEVENNFDYLQENGEVM